MRKRTFHVVALITFIILLTFGLTGCGNQSSMELQEGKINVVTTIYPIYDFAKQIGGEHANVMNLIPTGVEPHDWTPKSHEMSVASKAELLLYNGAGLEGWMPNFLQGLGTNSNVDAVEVSHGIELIHTDEPDGHEHGSDHDDHEGENTMFIDPHTWVSPKSALIMAENIKNSFIEVDAENRADYEANYEKLHEQLSALDQKFVTEINQMKRRDIVVSHQAFGYLCRDYGITQKSVMGLSPNAEPRSQDIIALTKYMKEHDIRYIFFEELVSAQMAQVIADEAGAEVLVLNPLEGLTKEQAESGDNYVTLMDRNLQNLLKALQ